MPAPAPRPLSRVAMVSVHTSPLEQPGTGDAGGLNVYVAELSRRLAERGVEVDVFTRATAPDQPPVVHLADGVRVLHVPAGPFAGLRKEEQPAQLCAFSRDVLHEQERAGRRYDLVHTHYWLSGQVGLVLGERWQVPLVHSAHTLARVKNAALAAGEVTEPDARVAGEHAVVEQADRLVANTADEAEALVGLYGADPGRVDVVAPGVDLRTFRPRDVAAVRRELDLAADAVVLTFVGRIQPLKAPDLLLRAAARLVADDPGLRERLVVAVVGAPSGSGLQHPHALADLAAGLGLADVVRFVPPLSRTRLARWYAASTVLSVPSYNESFGLVALEAQACGTPVVAARVGGLSTAVADGRSGVLVDGHDPAEHAAALGRIVADDAWRARLSAGALAHAAGFGWSRTTDGTLAAYAAARAGRDATRTMAS